MRSEHPSSTARLIARAVRLVARHPTYACLVESEEDLLAAQWLRRGDTADWFDFALRHGWARNLLWGAERIALRGIFLHYLARKRWIERGVVTALRTGMRQVVVLLGAGLDTLTWRLHREWPQVAFLELDHPATQAAKTATPGMLAAGENLELLPVDLGQELPRIALQRSARFDPALPTCFVAEGLLMYFPADQVTAMLRDLAGLPQATLVMSFMVPTADGQVAFRGGGREAIGLWLRLMGERFRWGIAPDELGAFLTSTGWRLETIAGAAELRAEILAPASLATEPLAEGECLAIATTQS